jgi:hypothetical protein
MVANTTDSPSGLGGEDTDHLMALPFRTNNMDYFVKS